MHHNYATCRKPSSRHGWYMLVDVSSRYHAYFPHRHMQYAHCNLTRIGFPPPRTENCVQFWALTGPLSGVWKQMTY